MDTKLTLKLDKEIIEKAKQYASEKQISLSRLIEFYLQSITSNSDSDEFEISPYVKSMATGKNVPSDIDSRKEYSEHLMKKYQ